MGATYTRQSTYSDGDVITAAHTNDEFNQLLAAFQASTGHTHDGTANEGGPITKMLGTSLTLGDGTAGTDITVTFDGETNDGVLKWMEDEDYFEFSDDILVASTEKIQFGDTATFLQQSSDGVLRIDGEATIDLNASTAVTVSNDLKLDSDSAVLGFGADNDVTLTHVADTALLLNSSRQLQFGDSGTYIHQSADGVLDLVSDTEIEINATTIDINGAVDVSGNLTVGGNIVIGSADISEAELEVLDGLTVTTAEVNIMDGDTSIGTTAVSDGHGIVMNHGGTMAQTTVQTLAAYLDDEITAMPNLVSTGALDSGSITSGFGAIDIGSSALSTTGSVTLGATSFGDNDITNVGSIQLDSIAGDADTNTSIAFSGSDVITVTTGGTTAMTIDASQNVAIAGDLTITGDDLTMGTNTSGHIMVADGANFNPVAVSGDVTISSAGAVTIANDAVETAMVNANVISGQSELNSAGVDITNDDLLIHDNDAGALKKVSVTNLISSAGGLTEVVADTSPQLGGDLDAQGKDLEDVGVSSADSHVGIYGSSSSPVEFTVTVGTKTAAHPYHGDGSSNAYFINGVESPALTLHGVDNVTSNSEYYYRFTLSSSDMSSHPFRLYLDADKTTAYTTGVTTTSTYLQIAVNEDTPSILYYQCSSHAYMGNHAIVLGSNKINHTEALISFPTTTGTLVGSGDTGTVTNDMLAGSIAASKLAGSIGDSKLSTISTAGKVELGALDIDGASDIGADLADADLIIVDDGAGGTEVKSELTRVKKYIYSAMSGDATASDAGALTIANDAVESGMLNDNIISGQTELASGLATTDELLVSDAGTIKRMDMSVVSTFMTSEGFSKEDPTALAIALG